MRCVSLRRDRKQIGRSLYDGEKIPFGPQSVVSGKRDGGTDCFCGNL